MAIRSPPGPMSRCRRIMRARSCSPSQRCSSLKPDKREKKAGTRRSGTRRPRPPGSPEIRAFFRYRGSTSRPRTRPRLGCAKARPDRRKCRTFPLRPMHAADAAGCEDLDAGKGGDEHGRGDRGSRRALARGDGARSRREAFTTPPESWPSRSISSLEGHSQTAVNDRDRRGNRAHLAHRILDGPRCLDVARVGHAMGDDRRFEGDDHFLAARASATSGEKSIRSAALMARHFRRGP